LRKNTLKNEYGFVKNKLIKNILFFEKASYICSRIQGIPDEALKEKWQSGRMRQS